MWCKPQLLGRYYTTAVLVDSKFALDCSRLRERGHIDILFCAVACVNFRANLKKQIVSLVLSKKLL